MPNRLIAETSPYLLQHADNPVDWYPWGEEALQKARAEQKPILLSIGYSACHWCHVMEHESFENPEIARIMNEHFVNVKVDREERPDLDAIYMSAVQAMTGHGGWPMTVFLTPEGAPFYGGTYFPPVDRHGLPAFPRLLLAVAEAWRDRRADLEQQAGQLRSFLQQVNEVRPAAAPLDAALLDHACAALQRDFDPREGGFGGAPKFPQPAALEFLLRTWHRTGDPRALELVDLTLRKQAHGGIYDQIGGGFHRYAVDDVWLVPHFEKMLYDNAQLARVYLLGYQATANPLYRRIAEETLDYLLRELAHPEGGFFSSQDADSEGEEGRFYVWTPAEIEAALGVDDARIALDYWGVSALGNFEGRNVLHVPRSPEFVARDHGLTVEQLAEVVARARTGLFAAREQRVHPGRDEKVLVAWNGLALRALAEAGRVLDRGDYLDAARRNAGFLLDQLRDARGGLLRSWKDGVAKQPAFLEDYALLAGGLVSLYEATFELRWLRAATALVDALLERFWDERGSAFYDTPADGEALVTRPRDLSDNATPSGNSAATEVLLRLARLVGNADYERAATRVLESVGAHAARYPLGYASVLNALDRHLAPPRELAVVGDPSAPATRALLAPAAARYLPNLTLAGRRPDDPEPARTVPILADRGQVDGRPTAYLCEGYVCQLPVTDPAVLAGQLDALAPGRS